MKCSEAEGKVKHVRNVQDLEDELEEYREKLSKAEKSLGRYGNLLRLFKGGHFGSMSVGHIDDKCSY